MEIDLDRLAEVPQAEVCVVGGGIAGLLLASRLAEAGVDVLLLEAGERRASPAVAEDYVEALGGTSLSWGGQLLPAAKLEGWPVSVGELAPYERELEQMLGVDDLPYAGEAFFEAVGVTRHPACGFGALSARVSKFVPFRRRNLAVSLGQALLRSTQARVALRGRAVGLELARGGDRAEAVLVRPHSGRVLRVKARKVVVAAGCRESVSLLEGSRSVEAKDAGWPLRGRLGRLGRDEHDHLTLSAAVATGAARERALRHFRPWIFGGLSGTVHSVKLEPAAALRETLGGRNGMAHFTFEEGTASGLSVMRAALRAQQLGGSASLAPLRQIAGGSADLWRLSAEAREQGRRFVSSSAQVRLQLNLSQAACARSRGASSLPVQEELVALRRFAEVVRAELEKIGFGEAQGMQWTPALFGGNGELPELGNARHAMGGAAMGSGPETSVVDAELRVHGVANLYVASTAVFPDGSPQLPTLTLMVLTLRLADRLLRERAQRRSASR